jgi:hypothetical protein
MPDNAAGSFIDELSNGDKAILGGSLVLLIAMFLPWYGAEFGGFSDSANGFHRWGLLTFLAWIAVVGLWLLRGPLSSQFKLPAWGITDGMLFMILGGVELLGIILFWIDGSGSVGGLSAFGVSVGVRFGLFIALVGAAATVAGGFLKQSEPAAASTGGGGGYAAGGTGGYGTPPAGGVTPPPPPSYGAPPSAPPAPPAAPPPSAPPSGGAPPPPPPA